MCVNKNAQTARTNGRSNDEAYLYLSGVVGVVMKRVVLFVVGVHTWPRPGPQALLQDLIVSRQLGSRDTTRLINSHVTQRGNRDLTSRKKKFKIQKTWNINNTGDMIQLKGTFSSYPAFDLHIEWQHVRPPSQCVKHGHIRQLHETKKEKIQPDMTVRRQTNDGHI